MPFQFVVTMNGKQNWGIEHDAVIVKVQLGQGAATATCARAVEEPIAAMRLVQSATNSASSVLLFMRMFS
jgi:hypothetical protein